ncbi:unnamed protein product [Albugo candida]|uniref:Uncharacterized protein n=1 Tax=Albugo candida TaxID=65357 RepID=A0A024GVP8_9STRA|nr:unnamed protein product [Albugo candida]|eukprot:CCI50758.1 unnamed protein product [Albugo candida]
MIQKPQCVAMDRVVSSGSLFSCRNICLIRLTSVVISSVVLFDRISVLFLSLSDFFVLSDLLVFFGCFISTSVTTRSQGLALAKSACSFSNMACSCARLVVFFDSIICSRSAMNCSISAKAFSLHSIAIRLCSEAFFASFSSHS